jgi:hypothetical protein
VQIKTLYEVPALLPVDEGPCRPQRGEALADLGGDGVIAALHGQFQSQATLDLGIAVREFDEDRGEALGAERHQVVQSDGLLRRHALILSWVQRIKWVREAALDLSDGAGWRWRVIRTSNSCAFTDPSPAADGPISSKSEKPTGPPNQGFFLFL